ncbi:diphthine methyltransferase [Leptinotarsa decemlineata]|uniref:diphthine methyltransferase n=1 Tax=Leptinotarsa decemlineata TaxID=7539 RepID=UPI003D305D3D
MEECLSKKCKTLFSFDTVLCADSVEWCPHKPFQNVFVCANYELEQDHSNGSSGKKRVGKIQLFSICPQNGLKLHDTIDTSGVLDQKWCMHKVNNKSLLGVVNADKKVEVYSLNAELLVLELLSSYEIDADTSETLILSLDWSSAINKSSEPEIICSDSKGNVHLVQLSNETILLKESYHCHEFEAWIAGFYYWNTNIFFSGGDDSLLLKFDTRVGNLPVSKNRSHGAGVTSIHSNISKENILATGSYDEHIRLWDIRNMRAEMNLIKMPGTLWRLKWDPFDQNYLLAACMLGGVHIVDVADIHQLNIAGSYHEHKNISYGADWCHLDTESCDKFEQDGQFIIGTCSFYDHLLCVSKFDSKKKD